MAKFHQGEAVFSLDNTSDSLTDFSASVQSVSVNISRDASQDAALNGDWKNGFVGARMVTGSIVAYTDSDTSSAYEALAERLWDTNDDASITMQIDQPDGTAGSIRLTGEIQIISGDETRDRNGGGPATASFNFQSDGAWTKSVISV
jgi:hypothetical protein